MGQRCFDRIEPWVHYVPVQADYSDVYDALIFFRGGDFTVRARIKIQVARSRVRAGNGVELSGGRKKLLLTLTGANQIWNIYVISDHLAHRL